MAMKRVDNARLMSAASGISRKSGKPEIPQKPDKAHQPYCRTHWQKGDWQMYFLDSSAEPDGMGSGSLSSDSLALLKSLSEQQASGSEPINTFLAVHHHPSPVGSQWQDEVMLGNGDAFWHQIAAIQAQSLPAINIRGVMFGHIHQCFRAQVQGISLFGSPATAPQFKAQCETFTLEEGELNQPAYSVYKLHTNGVIDARVEYVAS